MGRLIIYLIVLALIAAAGGVVYSLIAELPPPTRDIEIDVTPSGG